MVLAALVPGPGFAQEGGPIYVVQAGDSLSGIGLAFGTTVEALMERNNLTQAETIVPGQRLVIPGFEGVDGELVTRRVGYGETAATLASATGLTVAQILRLNRSLHPEGFYVGQDVVLLSAADEAGASPHVFLPDEEGKLRLALKYGIDPWRVKDLYPATARMWTVSGRALSLTPSSDSLVGPPLPLSALEMGPVPAEQGDTLALRADPGAAIAISGSLGEWDLSFVPDTDGTLVALQGIDALAEPGLFELSLSALDEEAEPLYEFSQPFPIRSGGYGFDPVLFVPDETIQPENTRAEDEKLRALTQPATPNKRWDGPFSFPYTHYTDSFPSVFGTRRNYNNMGYTAYHTGLDFYGGTGVPILAPAPGTVVFAGALTVRGLTTILDHGWGVYTLYLHQSEILVEEGQEVAAGDTIGLVGATGRVTGPHLHWEVQVGGVPVQPLDWVERGYP